MGVGIIGTAFNSNPAGVGAFPAGNQPDTPDKGVGIIGWAPGVPFSMGAASNMPGAVSGGIGMFRMDVPIRASLAGKTSNPWEGSLRPDIFTPIGIGEQVLFDDEGLKITLLEYGIDPQIDDFLKVKIENKTGNVAQIICNNLTVNGYSLSRDGWVQWIAYPDNMKKEPLEILPLNVWKLEAAGMKAAGRIDFHLSIASATGKAAKDITIRTSAYDQTDAEIKEPGTMLIDRDGVRIFGKYVDDGSRPTPYVIIYGENNSGAPRFISFKTVVCNGSSSNLIDKIILPDGRKSLNILPVRTAQPIDRIEVTLCVSDQIPKTPHDEGFSLISQIPNDQNDETFRIPVS